ncbi:hypothetical protein P7C73_g235, partial [Tremellales sp. Uapishka_1]
MSEREVHSPASEAISLHTIEHEDQPPVYTTDVESPVKVGVQLDHGHGKESSLESNDAEEEGVEENLKEPEGNSGEVDEVQNEGEKEVLPRGEKGKEGGAVKKVVAGTKGVAGDVKRVLKSGVFGVGSPKPTPKSAPTPTTTRPTPAPRQSLAPPPRKPLAASSTTASAKPPVGARLAASTSTRQSATSTTTGATRPAVPRPSTSTVTRPRTESKASVSSATSTPKPTSSTSATTVKPAANPLRTSIHGKSPSVSSVTRPTATTATTAAARRSSVAPTTTRPAAGRASMAPPVARTAPKTSLPAKKDDKETEELKAKVEELESQLQSEKKELGEQVERLTKEKSELEGSHRTAVEAMRLDLAASLETAVTNEGKIAELNTLHAAEIAKVEEERSALSNETAAKIQELIEARDQSRSELTATLTAVSAAEANLATASSTLDQVQAELEALRKGESESQAKIAEMESSQAALEGELTAMREIKMKLESELAEGVEEAEKSISGLVGAEGRVRELEDEVQALTEEMAALTMAHAEQCAEWAQERGALSKALEDSKGSAVDLERITSEHGAKAEALENLQIAHDQLTQTYSELLTTSARHPEALAELQEQMRQASAKHDALLQEAASLSDAKAQEIADWEGKHQDAAGKVAELSAKLEESEGEFAILEEARKDSAEKAKALEDVVKDLEGEIERLKLEHEEKFATVFEEAKSSANAEHGVELATLRSELAHTTSQFQTAHTAELDSLANSHSAVVADLHADHASAVQSLNEQLAGHQEQISAISRQLEEAKDSDADHEEEVARLEAALQKAGEQQNEAQGSDEELKRLRAQTDAANDELEGLKAAFEMNKQHFEEMLKETQNRHSEELQKSAESRVQESERAEKEHQSEVFGLKEEIQKLRVQVESVSTPPPGSPKLSPDSPSITKLHEAHNAKVAELEK